MGACVCAVFQLLEESLRLLADVRCASDATREMLARLVAPFVARFHTLGANHATGSGTATGGNGSSTGATGSQADSKTTTPMVVMDIGDATLASTGEAAAAAAQLDEDIKVITL